MEQTEHFTIHAAPLQGFTEAEFRHSLALTLGSHASICFTAPFVRVENNIPRPRDMRDVTSPLNDNLNVRPQIICNSVDEFDIIADALLDAGITEADINMGCPFKPQVKRGRGSGLLRHPDTIVQISDSMHRHKSMAFSVKMRLGIEQPDEWTSVIDIINKMPLTHVTIHPRTAAQQYKGSLDMAQASLFCHASVHPTVFNGDILEPEHIDRIRDTLPQLSGVMIGRGLVMRPSLPAEWKSGRQWSDYERRHAVLELHDRMME